MYCNKCNKEINDKALFCPYCGNEIEDTELNEGDTIDARLNSLFSLNNYSDLYVTSYSIDDEVRATIRSNFHIDIDDDIHYIRDTSFWNSRNQGTVVTNTGIICIPDNDKPEEIILLTWESIHHAEYLDLCIYFFGYDGRKENCPIHISHFLKDSDKYFEYGPILASIFSDIASLKGDPKQRLNEYIEKREYEKYLETSEAYLETYGEDIEIRNLRGYIYCKEYKDPIKALDECTAAEELIDETTTGVQYIYEIIGEAYKLQDNTKEARKYFVSAMENTSNKEEYRRYQSLFEEMDSQYKQNYLLQNYTQRKMLMPVDKVVDLSLELLTVMNIHNLPDIQFPMGHPVSNELYIGHPYTSNIYIPYQNYEFALFKDRVDEFCYLLQCWGASEFNITSIRGRDINESQSSDINMEGNIDYKVVKTSGNYHKQNKNDSSHQQQQKVGRSQKFSPTKSPYLPDGLVWYPNEPSWQRLFQQRINGNILFHNETISTSEKKVLSSFELRKIEVEFNSLLLKASGKYSGEKEQKLDTEETTEWTISVQFIPLSRLGKETHDAPTPISTSTLSESEKEYLEEVKACLAEDGEISSRERRLLNRLCDKLHISESRAAELEASLQTLQLTEEEKEYLEEYKACIEEAGVISPKERRLLDRLGNSLGIPADRIKEIEKTSIH